MDDGTSYGMMMFAGLVISPFGRCREGEGRRQAGKGKKQATDDKMFQLKKVLADLLSAKTPPLFSQLLAPSELSDTQQ